MIDPIDQIVNAIVFGPTSDFHILAYIEASMLCIEARIVTFLDEVEDVLEFIRVAADWPANATFGSESLLVEMSVLAKLP